MAAGVSRHWGRRAAAAASVVLLAALAGCSLRGEIHIVGNDEVRVDLRYVPDEFPGVSGCREYTPGFSDLEIVSSGNPDAPRECRVVGTLTAERDEESDLLSRLLMGNDDLFALNSGPVGYSETGEPPDVDVTVHFPGQVVAGNGRLGWTGSTMRWTDGVDVRDHGIHAVAERTPSLPGWFVPAVAGAGWGAVLVGLGAGPALAASRRRRAVPDSAAATEAAAGADPAAEAARDEDGPPAPSPAPAPVADAEDPSVWARDD